MRSSSQNNRYSCHDVHEIDQPQFNDSVQFEQDSITIWFKTQTRHTNVMFDEMSSTPSLQRVEFIWMPVHQKAFDQIKLHVSNDVKLQFYDAHKLLYIEVDKSKKGKCAVMLQEENIIRDDSKSGSEIPTNLRPISYASKTLSTKDSNYPNIECELLGLLFAVTHFKHFTYGRLVHVITDHKPLFLV